MIKYTEWHNGEMVVNTSYATRDEAVAQKSHRMTNLIEVNGNPVEWNTDGADKPDEYYSLITYIFSNNEQWSIDLEQVDE